MSSDNFIRAVVVYDPLDLGNAQAVELEYQPGTALAGYLDGLPEEVSWEIALDDVFIPAAALAHTVPAKGSTVLVAPVPHGGDSDGKSILALIATVALSFAAPWAAGVVAGTTSGTLYTVLTAGFTVAGGLLINAFIPKPDVEETAGEAYGIDGPKNTSQEGVPVPIIYGRHGFGGNMIDIYTENATDDKGQSIQFLYARVAVSEGPVKSIGDLRFNDQPIDSFDDVEIDYRLGGSQQTPSEWFDRTVSLYNQARDFTTDWQTYQTVDEVDKLRLDVVFPAGLIFRDNKGRENEKTVTLVMEYRRLGSADPWKGLTTAHVWANTGSITSGVGSKFRVNFRYTAAIKGGTFERGVGEVFRVASADPDYALEYRVNGGAWQEYQRYTGADHGPLKDRPVNENAPTEKTVTLEGFSGDTVEFRLVNYATVNASNPAATIEITRIETKNLVNPSEVAITEKSPTTLRRSFVSDVLPQARYEVRYRRVEEEAVEDTAHQDKATLADIGEIILDTVSLVHTAWAGFKVRLSGQLSSVPKFTGVCEGMIMPILDHEGEVVDVRYSDNPADVVISAYMNQRFGGKMMPERIDFAAFAEWRDYCDANNLKFNAIFTELGNIDEQIKHAYIAGRAQRISQGAKVSVAIDGVSEPVMMFNSSLIKRKSLKISYLPYSERINDLSVSYYDEDDLFQNRTVRAVNEEALARGEELKSTSISLKGITTRERAQREANFRMNYNRFVTRTAEWVAPLHGIACTVGDVVILQTEMVDWAEGGLLKDGSTATSLVLDRPVTFEAGKSYAVLVHRDKRKIADVSITSQSSNLVTVNAVLPDDGSVRRLKVGTKDYAVRRVLPDASTTDLLLENAPALSGAAEVWSTDVLDEVAVQNPGAGEYDTLTLSSALQDGAPPIYASFIFGESTTLDRKFRVTDMRRQNESEIEIKAVEYVPEVFDDSDIHTGTLYRPIPQGAHVSNLAASESSRVGEGGARFIEVLATWIPPEGEYVSALVQYRVDDGPWRDLPETADSSVRIPVVRGEGIRIRVIARTPFGLMPAASAPTFYLDVVGYEGLPEAPLNWEVEEKASALVFKEPKGVDREIAPYDTQLMFGDETYRSFQIWAGDTGSSFALSEKVAEFSANTFTLPLPINTSDRDYWITVTDSSGNVSTPSLPITAGPETDKAVTLTTTKQVFEYDDGGANPAPASATFTATAYGPEAGVTLYYDFLVDNVSQQNGTSNTFTYTPQASFDNMPQRVKVLVREDAANGTVTAADEITTIGLHSATMASVLVLSNEAHTIPSDADGSNADYTDAVSGITVYEGINEVTNLWTITRASGPGVTSNLNGGTLNVTDMIEDKGYVDVTATRTGYPTLIKRMSLAKSLRGTIGLDNITIDMTPTNVLLTADPGGNVLSYTSSGCEIGVIEGDQDLDYIVGADPNDLTPGSFQISNRTVRPSFNDIVVGNYSVKDQWTVKVGDHSTMDPTIATVFIDFHLRIKRLDGSIVNRDVRQSVGKAKNGVNGIDGNSVAQLIAFKRSATAPATPTGGSFNFDTMTLTPPTGWSANIPAGTDPLYAVLTTATTSGTGGVDNGLTWSSPTIHAQDGLAGKSTYQAAIYKRAASAPAAPSGGSFDFTNDVLTPPSGWLIDVPADDGNPVWVTRYLFSITGDEGSVNATAWATPTKLSENGADGADGKSTYLITVFRRSATDPGTPTGGSYDFGTEVITPPTDWSETVPEGADPVWVSTALASVQGITGADNSLTWSPGRLFVKNGSDGKSVFVMSIYKRAEEPPATPTGGSYNFGSSTGTPPAGWSLDVPDGAGTLYVSHATAELVGTDGIDNTLTWSTPRKFAADGRFSNLIPNPGFIDGDTTGWVLTEDLADPNSANETLRLDVRPKNAASIFPPERTCPAKWMLRLRQGAAHETVAFYTPRTTPHNDTVNYNWEHTFLEWQGFIPVTGGSKVAVTFKSAECEAVNDTEPGGDGQWNDDGDFTVTLRVHYYDKNQNRIFTADTYEDSYRLMQGPEIFGTNEWKRHATTFELPDNCAFVTFEFMNFGGFGVCYIADMNINEAITGGQIGDGEVTEPVHLKTGEHSFAQANVTENIGSFWVTIPDYGEVPGLSTTSVLLECSGNIISNGADNVVIYLLFNNTVQNSMEMFYTDGFALTSLVTAQPGDYEVEVHASTNAPGVNKIREMSLTATVLKR